MCSLGDDNFDNEVEKCMKEKEVVEQINKKCIKCRANPSYVVLRTKDAYCKECFVTGTTHKFKALLGKSRLIRPKDKVLVCYKVGHPSTALLHLVRNGLDLNTPKKLKFEPLVIYIEDQYHLNGQERRSMTESIKKHVGAFNFKLYSVSFVEYVLNPEVLVLIDTNNYSLGINENDKERLFSAFSKKKAKTKTEDFKHIFERNLLINAAKQLNCKFVFTPELSVDIASNLLTNLTLGRGSQIPLDTGFCDDRDNFIKILRPLRSFDTKELAFYNHVHDLEPIFVKQKEINPYSSVQNLMKKFVSELQESYPATVTTIVKTGDKLAVAKAVSDVKMCQLCKAQISGGNTELISAESTEFSKLVSTELQDHEMSRQERYSEIVSKFDSQFCLNNEYCFSCSKIKDYLL